MSKNIVIEIDGILKSVNDKRNYKSVTLNNGLQILAISDPDASTSAACLTVNIGSLDDGDIMGIAHFLEHMLFMGSVKYPDEACYNNYVSKYDGQTNAFTSDCYTCYYFSVPPSGFQTVLDIFGQFFISPLFAEST